MRLTSIAVFTAIAVLSIFQYQWAVSSGEKTILDLAKSYEFRVFGALAQEMSRIELFNQRPGINNFSRGADIRSSLDYIENQIRTDFGDGYIDSLSLIDLSTAVTFYSIGGGQWKEKAEVNIEREIYMTDSEGHDFHEVSLQTDPYNDGIILLTRRYPGERFVSVIHFNLKSFFKEELIPLINESLGSYSIALIPSLTDEVVRLEERNFTHSPIKTLLNYLYGREPIYSLTMPFLRVPMLRVSRESGKKIFDENLNGSIYISIQTDTGSSLFFQRELAIATQWLTGLLLLLGIGLAYSLILYQKNRLSRLRRKEKEFVATITHELRTPLTVIHSAADNIHSGILNEEKMSRYGKLIKEQSGKLSSMIEGILLFSRLEGKAEQVPTPALVHFQSIKEELEIFYNSLQQGDRLCLSIDFASLPPQALTDRDTLILLLTNLISNSFHHAYGPEEKGEIRITAHLKLPSSLIFSVDDDGRGIPRKEQKNLFEPFFRGEQSLTQQTKGSGLGLYLVERKVKLLGGTIRVASPYSRADGRLRNGTSITLSLPYIEAPKKGMKNV